ncbi:hypothetical protein [uncultured Methanomethylovorans sp.]|uniref:hypothetical protein n=1 Tax=uncultured Methanomethylovorans sp. TaxID=183759 RepID=UPI002636D027|nr:hypothetical protein [uncultured Methanomethylovorans sp.]
MNRECPYLWALFNQSLVQTIAHMDKEELDLMCSSSPVVARFINVTMEIIEAADLRRWSYE